MSPDEKQVTVRARRKKCFEKRLRYQRHRGKDGEDDLGCRQESKERVPQSNMEAKD